MSPHKIILNPAAGRGQGKQAVSLIEQYLQNFGVDYDLTLTERPWHAVDLARDAARGGFQCVVAAGGDGTANEVLNGLMQAKAADGVDGVAVGVLCVGQGNDFAYGMGVPTELAAGCQALAQDNRRTIDIGRVAGGLAPEGRYFGNGVGIGFDAVVGFEALKMTRLHGFLSYLVAALKTIFLYYRAPTVCVEIDGDEITVPALMVSVMNGRRMGGGFMMAPEGAPDDDQFDVCIARQVNRAKIFALIVRFMQGTQGTHPAISTRRGRKVVVTALEGALPAHADGETLCTEGHQLTLELLPRQLEIICEP